MNKLSLSLLFSCCLSLVAMAQNKQTYLYATKGADSLYLDVYSVGKPKGCVIYAFGGGFMMGRRDDTKFLPYFSHLNEKGYTAVSIDYRLGLKNISKDTKPGEFLPALIRSINMAVEDMYDATNYLIQNAETLGIDPTKIIISGSSAGAITSLHAEYEICRGSEISKRLPQGFNYAGVISMAGAITSIGTEPKWNAVPCPIAFFHGDADNLVPYDNSGILNARVYGSNYLVKQLKPLNAPYYFYIAENVDHKMASDPLSKHHRELDYFLDEYIEKERRLQQIIIFEDLSMPERPDNLQLSDYIKTLRSFVN